MEKAMQKYLDKAEVLIEALPYIQRFNRKVIVVKYGGSAMVDEELKARVIQDVTLLKLVGFKPIIVHVKEVNADIIYDLLEKDFLPIIAPIGLDDEYNTYNINADDAACAIAKAINAEKLAFLTDIEGVYKDPNDPSTLISELNVSEGKKLMEEGYIGGGMLPKIQNCIDAIENGVSRVHILDGRIPHCVLLEIFTNKGIGTAILNDSERRYYDGE